MLRFARNKHNSHNETEASLRPDKKNMSKMNILTLIILFVSLFIIMSLSIFGWFASNRNVEAGGMKVSLGEGPLFLGTLGVDEKYSDELHTMLGVPQGQVKEIDGQSYYITSGSTVSMQVSEDSNLNNDSLGNGIMPGSLGKLEFYLIVNKEGINKVKISLDEAAYVIRGGSLEKMTLEESLKEADEYSSQIIGSNIYDLLKGHILFFKDYDERDGYSNIIDDWTFNVSAADYGESEGFQVDKPYKITVYWIWPSLFENFIYPSVNQDGHLTSGYLFGYSEKEVSGETKQNETRQKLLSDMKLRTNSFFTGFNEAKIGEYSFYDLTSGQFNYFSDWYNDADVLIGKYVNYLYLNFYAEVVNE